MIFDLNVPWPVNDYTTKPTSDQIAQLKSSLAILEEFGYTHVAINLHIDQTVKIPTNLTEVNPIKVDKYFPEFKDRLKIFTRITLNIDDPSQCQGLAKISQHFDLISIRPLTEKALLLAITNLEIDIISLDLGKRLPSYLKHKTVCSGIEKGIFFEINYKDMICINGETNSRKSFFSNTKSLIRASRSRGLIVSSGSTNPLQIRAQFDVVNTLCILGLDSNRANATMRDWSAKALLSGRLRIKSFKQVIAIGGDDNLIDNSKESSDNSKGKLDTSSYKKRKPETVLDRQRKIANKKRHRQ